jgi:hypothetical protein
VVLVAALLVDVACKDVKTSNDKMPTVKTLTEKLLIVKMSTANLVTRKMPTEK